MTGSEPNRPIVMEFPEDADDLTPETAAPIIDAPLPVTSVQTAARVLAHKPNRLLRWGFALFGVFLSFVISLAVWDYMTALLNRFPILGLGVAVVLGLLACVALIIVAKEWLALMRLSRVDRLQKKAANALADDDLAQARDVGDKLVGLYKNRKDASWGLERFKELRDDILDAEGVIASAETTLLAPLDRAAIQQVESGARQVATITALMPIALADVIAALVTNLRMIRQIGELYGGRSGTLGSLRLGRSVLTHLVATGAVAIGDDLLGSVAGGSILSKFSRRFGEGVINGALTARVGVAAIEVCRPVAFHATPRPSVAGILKRSVTGLFSKE